ncbi:MAG TPA: hypothetical protein VF762_20790 [Blastocatellia bacterium]|jgi:hypothetical protein
MEIAGSAKHVAWLLVIILLLIVSLAAPRPAHTALSTSAASQIQRDEPDQEGVTFDNLLTAGSYSLYIEARNIGQQVHSGEIIALIEPLKPMLNGMQNEYTIFGDFIAANADALSRSRVMVATQPARSSLPPLLIAVELASADAAETFEQKLREFLALVLKSGVSATQGLGIWDHSTESAGEVVAGRGMNQIIPLKRAGRLLVVSLTPFTFKGLRAQSEKSISDDFNFHAARDRFYSEPLFIYYDMALAMRVTKERADPPSHRAPSPPKTSRPGTPLSINRPTIYTEHESHAPLASNWQEQAPANTGSSFNEDSAQSFGIDSETSYQTSGRAETLQSPRPASPSKSDAAVSKKKTSAPPALPSQTKSASGKPAEQPAQSRPVLPTPPQPKLGATVQEVQREGPDTIGMALRSMINGLFNNISFPDAVAIALTFESDSLAVRLLMLNAPGTRMGPIPFLPVLISGPPQASDAASYMPSDTDVFVTASVDLYQLYEMGLSIVNAPGVYGPPRGPKDKDSNAESGIAALEKRLGFKIKEDLLSTLGNEVAIGVPARYLSGTPLAQVPLNSQTPQAGPVFLISVRNKEALQAKLNPALEAVGLKAPNEKGISEKFGEIEINTYSNGSVAFINNFLVIGNTAATVRHLLEARAKDQTLMTSRDFHSYMQWQPRETVAQLYVSAEVLKSLLKNPPSSTHRYDEETKQFLTRFDFDPEPITYAATSDATGPLYEVRIPKNLLIKILAQISVEETMGRGPKNEIAARNFLNMLNESEKQYQAEHGRFGTLEEVGENHGGEKIFRSFFDMIGYKIEFTLSGDKYTATATPAEYGKGGKISFYTDNTGVIRGADHGGRPATAADNAWFSSRDQ